MQDVYYSIFIDTQAIWSALLHFLIIKPETILVIVAKQIINKFK